MATTKAHRKGSSRSHGGIAFQRNLVLYIAYAMRNLRLLRWSCAFWQVQRSAVVKTLVLHLSCHRCSCCCCCCCFCYYWRAAETCEHKPSGFLPLIWVEWTRAVLFLCLHQVMNLTYIWLLGPYIRLCSMQSGSLRLFPPVVEYLQVNLMFAHLFYLLSDLLWCLIVVRCVCLHTFFI